MAPGVAKTNACRASVTALSVGSHVGQVSWAGGSGRGGSPGATGGASFPDSVSDACLNRVVQRPNSRKERDELKGSVHDCQSSDLGLECVHNSPPVNKQTPTVRGGRAVTPTWRVCESEYRDAVLDAIARGALVSCVAGALALVLLTVALVLLGAV
jgi:hypothetical protein